jgi:hypothetical protein
MIGKTINYLLTQDSTLVQLVGTKIYPYVAPNNTELPCIVYKINTLTPFYTKGGWGNDVINFSVFSFHPHYDDLQAIYTRVRAALELKTTGYGSQSIGQIRLESQDEGFELEGNLFYNVLNFNVTVNTY